MMQRSEMSDKVKSYIAMFETIWSFRSAHLSKIRFDNTRENVMKELKLYWKERGIELKTAPEYEPHSNGLA